MSNSSPKNEFMQNQGDRLSMQVRSALSDFGEIYCVFLLIKSPTEFETLYVIGSHAEDPLGAVTGLEHQVNAFLPNGPHLPGDRGIRFIQTEIGAMRAVARPYVRDRSYHLIISEYFEALRNLVDSYINPLDN